MGGVNLKLSVAFFIILISTKENNRQKKKKDDGPAVNLSLETAVNLSLENDEKKLEKVYCESIGLSHRVSWIFPLVSSSDNNLGTILMATLLNVKCQFKQIVYEKNFLCVCRRGGGGWGWYLKFPKCQ